MKRRKDLGPSIECLQKFLEKQCVTKGASWSMSLKLFGKLKERKRMLSKRNLSAFFSFWTQQGLQFKYHFLKKLVWNRPATYMPTSNHFEPFSHSTPTTNAPNEPCSISYPIVWCLNASLPQLGLVEQLGRTLWWILGEEWIPLVKTCASCAQMPWEKLPGCMPSSPFQPHESYVSKCSVSLSWHHLVHYLYFLPQQQWIPFTNALKNGLGQ